MWDTFKLLTLSWILDPNYYFYADPHDLFIKVLVPQAPVNPAYAQYIQERSAAESGPHPFSQVQTYLSVHLPGCSEFRNIRYHHGSFFYKPKSLTFEGGLCSFQDLKTEIW